MKKLNNKGFGAVEILLILIIVGIIGAVGWFVMNNSKNKAEDSVQTTTQPTSTESKVSANTYEGWKTYSNKYGKFSVKYPDNWVLKSVESSNGAFSIESDTLTSPTGTKLILKADSGGRGGDCTPAKSDKPFAAGNMCATGEYLSKESLNIKNIYYSKDVTSTEGDDVKYETKPANVIIYTKHYATDKGKDSYIVGVTEDSTFPIELNKPAMGLILIDESLNPYDSKGNYQPYIYIYAVGSAEAFLKSKDADTIKDIMRSLSVNYN